LTSTLFSRQHKDADFVLLASAAERDPPPNNVLTSLHTMPQCFFRRNVFVGEKVG